MSLPLPPALGAYGEPEQLAVASLAMVASGLSAAAALSFVTAPYGRYSARGGAYALGLPPVPAPVAWCVQEAPSFLVAAYCAAAGGARGAALPNAALLALYLSHYFYRAFVFPFRIVGGKPTPAGVAAMAFAFCLVNGWMQARWLATAAFAGGAGADALLAPRVALGVLVWAVGLAVNLDADATLRGLRRPGETGYKIPRGGAFELVSGANFFGEIVEWAGFAIAATAAAPVPAGFARGVPWLAAIAQSPAAPLLCPPVAFAIFTLCNIGPRGAQHHAFYKKTFGAAYPKGRRAVIPFVW